MYRRLALGENDQSGRQKGRKEGREKLVSLSNVLSIEQARQLLGNNI